MDTQGNVCAPAVTLESLYQMVLTMRPYVRARIRNDAEDCMHDTVIAVAEALEQNRVRNIRCLRAYAWTTLRRLMRARITAGSKLDPLDGADRWAAKSVNPERQAIAGEVCESMSKLAPGDREILTRTYLEGESNEEICQAMKLRRPQLRVKQLRARRRLKAALLAVLAVVMLRPKMPTFDFWRELPVLAEQEARTVMFEFVKGLMGRIDIPRPRL